jgi:hypothetical protein
MPHKMMKAADCLLWYLDSLAVDGRQQSKIFSVAAAQFQLQRRMVI